MQNGITKLYPGWKEATVKIVERVSREGYGIMFSHEDLYAMMDIKVPEMATPEVFKKHAFEVMASTLNLFKCLLEEHNLCLHNVRGQGYQVLHPDDQVTIAADKRFKRALHHIGQAVAVLTHVDVDALSFDGQQEQVRRLGKAAFLFSGLSKKKKVAENEKLKALPE
jgi:hypothetical protein